MVSFIIGKSAELVAGGKRFQKCKSRFVASGIADVNAMLHKRDAEGSLKKPHDETSFGRAFGDD